jgi:peptidoglycan/xylan/chitin deacetylase (PgdA/CDA1 family)
VPSSLTDACARRALSELGRRRSLVLGYHGVGAPAAGQDPHNLLVSPGRFRRQVELLRDAGFDFVTVAELAKLIDDGPPPAGRLALSFDDGMEDNHSELLPILRDYGIPATVYVATGFIGKANPFMGEDSQARMMTVRELRELAAAGVELGAHTVTHPDLSVMSRDDCLREMKDSRTELARLTGAEVTTFAYPFCRYGVNAIEAAREAGFLAAVTCEGRGGWKRFELGRAMLTGKDGLASFLLKLFDVYQPLFDSLPGQAVRASTRRLRGRLSSSGTGFG